jgi:hypothetical protein
MTAGYPADGSIATRHQPGTGLRPCPTEGNSVKQRPPSDPCDGHLNVAENQVRDPISAVYLITNLGALFIVAGPEPGFHVSAEAAQRRGDHDRFLKSANSHRTVNSGVIGGGK